MNGHIAGTRSVPAGAAMSSQLAQELRETLGRVVRRLRGEPAASVSPLAVLMCLDSDGPSSIGDLAAHERIRPTALLPRLELARVLAAGPFMLVDGGAERLGGAARSSTAR